MAGERPATPPLGVLDLVPVLSGGTAADALADSLDLARRAEELGYVRHWFAEHHLNPGVAGTSPAVLIALAAAATSRIRLGSGALLLGHRTALATVEEFGLIDALHPGRLDLGLGRSGGRPPAGAPAGDADGPGTGGAGGRPAPPARPSGHRAPNGLLIPPAFSYAHLASHPRSVLQQRLLHLPGARSRDYAEQVAEILDLLGDGLRSDEGVTARPVPGTGARVQVWILGSSGGTSAEVAGRHGLPFAANYHVSPAGVLEAAAGYRAAFRPSATLDRPYLTVSADVVVAEDEDRARRLAAGYAPWVHGIRTGEGARPYPAPEEAAALEADWTDRERAVVADRVDTRFVGTPDTVAGQLERLAEATGADELLITTITHRHADRVRSYALLAEEWDRRAAARRRPVGPGAGQESLPS
ncbi:LLM class flavin-dependent oxidoreductase [Streptomyces sp. NPDC097619]|uniref:LLM class flavin-dependent oxidoreductase n=1 Tax=Streptomyces sp. NPDC097619 TaxID=3157228 RepID=UPI00331ECA41